MSVRIIIADVMDGLRSLPDESVHCVVTSPPYWGLRDYETATWVGGDPACEHRSPTMREGRNEARAKAAGSAATNSAQLLLAHRSACAKCGAVKVDQQIGLEPTMAEHIAVMVDVFREVRRVLRKDGTCWINYGDCYATAPNGRSAADTKAAGNDDRTFRDKPFSTIGGTLKAKDLCMIPNRLAIALQDDGWWVRSEIIWHKPNPMPESIKDRPGTSHEKIWLLSKSERYFYDAEAVREPVQSGPSDIKKMVEGKPRIGGKHKDLVDPLAKASSATNIGRKRSVGNGETRNMRNVWSVPTCPYPGAHFATFPPELPERCIKAGCPEGGVVLDPFGGAGTTGLVADRLQRDAVLIELNPGYAEMAQRRIQADGGLHTTVTVETLPAPVAEAAE